MLLSASQDLISPQRVQAGKSFLPMAAIEPANAQAG
jgi:hypothetical protein